MIVPPIFKLFNIIIIIRTTLSERGPHGKKFRNWQSRYSIKYFECDKFEDITVSVHVD